jgi:murein DD-endopeptidase / murein LD-carboxypeptidase
LLKKITIALISLSFNFLSAQTDSLVGDESTDLVAINTLLREAGSHLGTHYRGGGKSPSGFDCSGFVGYCYNITLGIRTPASSSLFHNAGVHVPIAHARPGDVICFKGHSTSRRIMGHVGIITEVTPTEIYFIHSASSGGIRYDVLSAPYYRVRFMDIRRFF